MDRLLAPEIALREIPVEQVIYNAGDIEIAAVVMVEVIRVLPYIEHQQRPLPVDERRVGVCRRRYLELAPGLDEPYPAAAEQRRRGRLELAGKRLVAAEIGRDALGERAGECAFAVLRAQAVPEEAVVPGLGGIVEGAAAAALDDGLQRLALQRRALDQRVQLVHVAAVMRAVMQLQRRRRDHRLERVVVVGERGQCDGHSNLQWTCAPMVVRRGDEVKRNLLLLQSTFPHSNAG